ncbi:MAG: TSUP family transporter [Clostridia bacterium]|nr:TSUP family transporter [Deltaproteobacteria bacterium]
MLALAFLLFASFSAGLIDAVAGGGGLVSLPAFFSAYPNALPSDVIGTNKVAAIAGTSTAAIHYVRRVRVYWSATLPAMVSAFVFAVAGAQTLTYVPSGLLRQALPFVLVVLLAYMLAKKNLGQTHAPALAGKSELLYAIAGGSILGFYDGFFGPGTGSFLMLFFVRVFGYDFLHASASTKIVNVATNLAAILLLGLTGHVWWHIGLPLAAANIVGGAVGARIAVRYGSHLVRRAFIVVVMALALKTFYDAFLN